MFTAICLIVTVALAAYMTSEVRRELADIRAAKARIKALRDGSVHHRRVAVCCPG